MTEAIFGLVGVVIGGLLNGGVTMLTERSRRRASAKTAARIVIGEVGDNELAIKLALEEGRWAFIKTAVDLTAATEHRATLAATLKDPAWLAFDSYYAKTRELVKLAELSSNRRRFEDDEGRELGEHLSSYSKAAVDGMRRLAGYP
jgi:hypothetical protein